MKNFLALVALLLLLAFPSAPSAQIMPVFSPTVSGLPVTLGNVLWLDASDETTIAETGGSVSQWDDKSPEGNDVSQGTGSKQPTTGARVINGLNALEFDGGDAISNSVTQSTLEAGDNFSVFAVFQYDDVSTYRNILNSDTGVHDRLVLGSSSTENFCFSTYTGSFTTKSVSFSDVDTPHIFSGTATSANVLASELDGTTMSGIDTGATQEGDRFVVGAAANEGNFFMDGLIAEIIIYDRALTAGEITAVEAYLTDKWIYNVAEVDSPALHFDAADASTIAETGGSVSQWSDKSGRDNHATQSTGSLQALYQATGMNAKPALYSDGSTDKGMTFDMPLSVGDDYTLFVVCKGDTTTTDPTTASSLNGVMSGGNLNNADSYIGINQTRDDHIRFRTVGSGQGNTKDIPPAGEIITMAFDQSFLDTYTGTNLDEHAATTTTTQTVTGGYLFKDDHHARSMVGWVQEVVLYDRYLTAEEILQVQLFLQNKWFYNVAGVTSPALHLDASDETTIAETGGSVSQWDDKSDNERHVTQGTGSKQPATNSTTINGLNSIDFDGTADAMAFSSVVTASDWTVFTILDIVDNGSVSQALMGSFSSPVEILKIAQYNGTNKLGFTETGASPVDGASTIDSPYGTPALVSWRRSGNDVIMKSGATEDTLARVDPDLHLDYLGSFNGTSDLTKGGIGEVLVYDRLLTTNEITAVETYLQDKWGLPNPQAQLLFATLAASPAGVVSDESGEGSHAELTKSAGIYFDGTTKIVLPDQAGKSIHNLKVRFKPDAPIDANTATPFRLIGHGTWPGIAFGQTTSSFASEVISVFAATNKKRAAQSITVTAEWHTLEIDWDGSKYLMYLDDVELVTTVSGADALIPFTSLTVGGRTSAADGEYVGQMAGLEISDDSGIVLHYPMAEAAGEYVYDVSGNDQHATIVAATQSIADGRDVEQPVYHYNILNGFDTAPEFNSDAYVDLPTITLPTSHQFVVEFSMTDGTGKVCLYGGTSSTTSLLYRPDTAKVYVEYAGAIDVWADIPDLADGEVHKIIVTKTASLALLNIDGTSYPAKFVNNFSGDVDLLIGSSYARPDVDWRMNGVIHEVTVNVNSSAVHNWNFSDSRNGKVRDTAADAHGEIINNHDGFWAKQIPAGLDGSSLVRESLSNPAGAGHNGARTSLGGEFGEWRYGDTLDNPHFFRQNGHLADRFTTLSRQARDDHLDTVMEYTEDIQ